ncbi:MAG: ribonuclease D [Fimbriiglobus sp.]
MPPRRRSVEISSLPEEILTTPRDYDAFLDHLSQCRVMGLDTEFVGEESFRPELCLVQVSTPERLALLDPYVLGDLREFWEIAVSPERMVVVHAGREETRMAHYAVGKAPANLFDLQIAAGLLGFTYPIGYAALVAEMTKIRMNKSETLTDWRRRPLTTNQIRYAFDDVRYLLPIWRWMGAQLTKMQRMTWAKEEFHEFIRGATGNDPTVERWRKVKGVGALNRRELAVARAVHEWRESFAARINRPARVLMRDDIIVEIAKQGATKNFDLNSMRGLPRGENEPILAAVKRANALPLAQCPELANRDNDSAPVNTVAGLLSVALQEFCHRNKIAPALTATMSDLKQLIRSRIRDEELPADCSLASGWRTKQVLPYLDSLLDGSMVLRVAELASEHPIRIERLRDSSSPPSDEL